MPVRRFTAQKLLRRRADFAPWRALGLKYPLNAATA
jgi:hypothetical protein